MSGPERFQVDRGGSPSLAGEGRVGAVQAASGHPEPALMGERRT